MKNHTTFGKRLLAFALALVMVLSYVPGTAIAEETSTPEAVPVKYFKAVLNRELTQEATYEEGTDTELTPALFKYTVSATLGDETVTPSDIFWFEGHVEKLDETHNAESSVTAWRNSAEVADTDKKILTVAVEYEGMIILLSNEAEETAQVTATWDLQAPTGWNTTMYVGIPVAVNPAAFSYNKHSFGSLATTNSVNEEYVSYAEETGLVASKTSDGEVEIFRQTVGTADVVYAEYVANAKITWPELNTKFVIGEKEYTGTTEWFTEDQTVAITVSNAALVDETYLPEVLVNSAVDASAVWTAHATEEKTWTTSVTLTEKTTIKVGNDQLNVQIDKNAPEITNAFGYIKGDKAIVNFSVVPSTSGIKSVLVNDTEVVDSVNDYQVETDAGNVTIKVTGNNGLTDEATVTPQAGLNVTITPPATLGSSKYVAQGAFATIKVTGATDTNGSYPLNQTDSTVTNNGEAVAVTWTFADGEWTAKVPVPETGLNNLKASVKDTYRTAEATLGGEYKFDITDPVVTVSKDVSASATLDGVDYYQDAVTYTVKITDETPLNAADLLVQYQLEGAEVADAALTQNADGSYTAAIKVENGQKLVDLGVSAKDSSGNATKEVDVDEDDPVAFEGMKYSGNDVVVDTKNPTVSFAVSSNVTQFYVVDGVAYAYIDVPVTDIVSNSTTVVVSATASDANLADLSALNPGWTKGEDNTWTCSKTVKDLETGVVSFSFTVKDKAGNVPTGNAVLTANGTANGVSMTTTLNVAQDGKGTYTGSFNVDRRFPSGDADTVPPVINLTCEPDATYGGVDVFHKTYKFNVIINDISTAGADSGVASVTWALEDAATGMTICENPAEIAADGKYTISGEIKEGTEAANVKLKISVSDHVGNSYTYTKEFHVDNKAPVVTVEKTTQNPCTQVKDNVGYYKSPVTYTVTVTDLFMAETGFEASAISEYADGTTSTDMKFTVAAGQTMTAMKLAAKDAMGNVTTVFTSEDADTTFDATGAYTGHQVMVNGEAPTVEVNMTVENNGTAVEGENTFYYSQKVTYSFAATDKDNALNKATVKYTFEDGSEGTLDLLNEETSFDVAPGKVLTGIEIVVADVSGVYADKVTGNAAGVITVNAETMTYNGKKIAVDDDIPQITVEKTVADKYIRSLDGHDYYNNEVTYNITIADKFVESGLYSGKVTVNFEKGGEPKVYELVFKQGEGTVAAEDQLTASFTVTNDEPVKDFTIEFTDVVGKAAVVKTINDADALTSFSYSEGINTYAGNTIVVDTTAPVVSAKLTAKGVESQKDFAIENFYKKGDSYYAYLTPSVANNNWFSNLFSSNSNSEKEVEVVLTFTLDEINPNAEALLAAGWVLTDDQWTYTVPVTVVKDSIQVLEFKLETKDMADNVPKAEVTVQTKADKTEGDYAHIMTLQPDATGVYSGSIYIDRKTPVMADAPTITLTENKKAYADVEGKELFNDSFSFTLKVTDNTPNDAGIRSVTWTLDDGLGGEFLETVENANGTPSADGVYTIPVTIKEGVQNETGNACLTLTVEDHVGNVYTYARYFSVDNLGSRVTVMKEVEEGKSFVQTVEADKTDYYNGEVTYYVLVEDMNLDEEKVVIQYTLADETTTQVELASLYNDRVEAIVGSFTLTNDQVLTDVQIVAPDVPENASSNMTVEDTDNLTSFTLGEDNITWGYAGNDVAIDKTTPKVTVSKSLINKASYFQTGDDEINYFNGDIAFKVEAEDDFLTSGVEGTQKLILTFTYEDGTKTTVDLSKADSAWVDASEAKAGTDKYTYTIPVANAQVLKEVTIQAIDNSGNAMTAEDLVIVDADAETEGYIALSFAEANDVWTSSAMFAVDTEPAEVTVVKEGAAVIQNVDSRSYHAGDVTYTVTIKDEFLNNFASSDASILVTYLDGSKEIKPLETPDVKAGALAVSEDSYTQKFTLTDGDAIASIDVLVRDNAGNYTSTVTVEDKTAEKANFSYEYKDTNCNKYVGTAAIVDSTKPTAKLVIEGNVKKYYTFEGVTYIELNTPADALSGLFASQAEETITLKLTVSDKNITLDSGNMHPVKTNIADDTGKWSGTPVVNTDSTVTYTKQITVASDKTGVIEVDMTIRDLAGNDIVVNSTETEKGIEITPINDTVPLLNLKDNENGSFRASFSVDRRRPSSADEDNKAPEITIKPRIGSTTSSNGKELYGEAFTFDLDVTDGEKNKENSGLREVSWTIADNRKDSTYVVNDTQSRPQKNGVYSEHFEIPVAVNGTGESNDVTLTICAVDNVGNITTYVKEFAVDNQAPRITVDYDNDAVLNGRYFRADRIATITVTDINFNPEKTTITTQVTPTGWVQVDEEKGIWTCTSSYTVDGEYTFAMESTDLAKHETEDTGVNYIGEATKDFVVDKTAPVITVTYTPAQSKGTDPLGVQYYDTDLNTTVSIREVNFDAGDVIADFGGRNQLSAWTGAGDMHSASATFTEGNEYFFSIEFEDLAGNPAVGYKSETFSVDYDAPTITVSRGGLDNDGLNIVQDDLTLSFTINDAEENLKNYSIKVTRLNNAFQEETVSGADFYTVTGDGNRTTVVIDFNSIAKTKENDGIYTIRVSAEDYAGLSTSLNPEMVVSLNRFGSTFMTDDAFTTEFLTPSSNGQVYNQSVDGKLVIKEINPNQVWQDSSKSQIGSAITISANGVSTVLKAGTDYTVTMVENGNGRYRWYTYTYEIDPSIFYDNGEVVDGRYTILLYGEDEAGNMNTNESNEYGSVQKDANGEYTGKVEFTLDHMAPVIAVTGIEAKETYDSAFERMQITISDNSPSGIVVYLDDELVDQYDSLVGLSENDVWVAYDGETGNYVLNVTEKTSRQSVKIVATDAAGNSSEYAVEDFLITTKTIVQLFNNPFFLGGLGILGVLGVTIPIPIIKKKRAAAKNNNQKV